MENNATISLPILFLVVFSLFVSSKSFSQRGFYTPLNLDTVHFSLQDFGRMWTFDDVPVERFEEKYNFSPNEDWLEHVQKSALQFGGGCSASFVSANGLIMTNHHCGRNQLHLVQKEGENLLRDGFYSESLKEERKIPGLYVDQLQFIVDVTDSIKSAIAKGKTDNEKVELEKKGISRVAANFSEETGLLCKVVKLYYGGKYSLYGYKRYKDIRLVMSPDFQIAATGWDWDNFTYPRYELDFAFYRAYDENGEPVKVNNYFKWSKAYKAFSYLSYRIWEILWQWAKKRHPRKRGRKWIRDRYWQTIGNSKWVFSFEGVHLVQPYNLTAQWWKYPKVRIHTSPYDPNELEYWNKHRQRKMGKGAITS